MTKEDILARLFVIRCSILHFSIPSNTFGRHRTLIMGCIKYLQNITLNNFCMSINSGYQCNDRHLFGCQIIPNVDWSTPGEYVDEKIVWRN